MNKYMEMPQGIPHSVASAFYGRNMENSTKLRDMTDREIVAGLIDRDPLVTCWFLYVKCRPLFLKLIRSLFNYPIEYHEFADEVMVFLLENNERRLRQFDYKSTLCHWLKICLIRYFLRNDDVMIEDVTKESPYVLENENSRPDQAVDQMEALNARLEMEGLLGELAKTNRRYAHVVRRIVLEDAEYETVAGELNVQVGNLYNIKRRAMDELTKIALSLNEDLNQAKL